MEIYTGEKINNLIKKQGNNKKLQIFCEDGFHFTVHFGNGARGFPSLDDAKFYDYLEICEISEFDRDLNFYMSRAKTEINKPIKYDYVPAKLIDRVIDNHQGLNLYRQLPNDNIERNWSREL